MKNKEIGNLALETAQPITEQQIQAIIDMCASHGKSITWQQAKEFIQGTYKQIDKLPDLTHKQRMKNLQNKI